MSEASNIVSLQNHLATSLSLRAGNGVQKKFIHRVQGHMTNIATPIMVKLLLLLNQLQMALKLSFYIASDTSVLSILFKSCLVLTLTFVHEKMQ